MKQVKLFLITVVLVLTYANSIWAQTNSDVSFDTVVMTYPFDKKVKIPLIGTERFAKNIKGEAVIERRKSVTLIQIDLGRLPPPSQLSPASATYVVWAVTSEGIIDNIGEYRQRDSETMDNLFGSEFSTSTPHRSFSLIITAEPHYLVTSPSRLVVVANQGAREAGVTGGANKINFSGDADFERILVTPDPVATKKDSKYPIELLQARNALEIAKYYEAETYAQTLFDKAKTDLERGEQLYRSGSTEEAKIAGDLAIRQAVQARSLAAGRRRAKEARLLLEEKESEITRLEDQARSGSQSAKDLQAKLDEAARRAKNLEQDNDRLLREVDLAKRELDLARNDSQRNSRRFEEIEDENRKLREELDRVQKNVQVVEKERDKDRQVQKLREQVMSQFETRRDGRGTVLIVPDSYFAGETSVVLSSEGSFKLEVLVSYLKELPNNLIVEGFTDSRGTQDARMNFTKGRVESIMTFFSTRGVNVGRVQGFAQGSSTPRADNKTVKGRAANRRIEITIVDQTPSTES